MTSSEEDQTEEDQSTAHTTNLATSSNNKIIPLETALGSTATTYPWKKLLTNSIFCSRIIIIAPALFVLFLCICYTISSLLQLRLDDYWCNNNALTLKQIRDHSMEIENPEGVIGECWAFTEVNNDDLLFSRQSYGYEWVYDASAIFRFCLLLILSII